MQTALERSRSRTGIALICAGVACLAVNDALVKTLTDGYAPVQILFLRNLIALPPALIIALAFVGKAALLSRRPLAHLVRGGFWTCAAVLYFIGLRHLELAEATALVFAELLSNLVYRESSGGLFLISCLFNAVYKFNAIDDIC